MGDINEGIEKVSKRGKCDLTQVPHQSIIQVPYQLCVCQFSSTEGVEGSDLSVNVQLIVCTCMCVVSV